MTHTKWSIEYRHQNFGLPTNIQIQQARAPNKVKLTYTVLSNYDFYGMIPVLFWLPQYLQFPWQVPGRFRVLYHKLEIS